VIGDSVISSGWSIVISVSALGLLLQKKIKISEPALVAAAALIGLVAFG